MLKRSLTIAATLAVLFSPIAASAQAASPPPPNDYSDKINWLCWPGAAEDACKTDLDSTVVTADGATRVERFVAGPHPPIDCFYVYPTVSNDPGIVSTMKVESEETRVVAQQFARLGANCRLFAPMYRQFTLTALRAAMASPATASQAPRPITPFTDVRDAWTYYLSHENHGRGVVLVGHSQGSGVLTQLIKSEIDGKPAHALLVSALLMGTSLVVPSGADVGGDFKTVPLCHAADQTGCVIAYASFRETSPPPANSRFGRPRTPTPGGAAACVNPASLAGGSGALHSYFPATGDLVTERSTKTTPWIAGKTIATPFVSVPGLLTAHCVSTPEFNYLAIHINDTPGPRAHDIPGDIVVGDHILTDWGLHLIDANLAMGNLVDIVHAEGGAWVAKHP